MKTIGFVKSTLEHEARRALLPSALENIDNPAAVFIEEGYGAVLGIKDAAYAEMGAHIVSRVEALQQAIVCDLKVGEADYLTALKPHQTIFGWMHAENNPKLVDILQTNKLTAIAWEEMFHAGRHVFWKNNWLAGEAAVLHAFTLFGKLPSECKVALIGRGNVSLGAHKMLSALGADVKIFNRATVGNLRNELGDFDVMVNGVLWDKARNDHLLYKEDLKRLKQPALIIDVSADEAGAIETSQPTYFEKPTYEIDGVLHYVVDHTPTIFKYPVSESISAEIAQYLNDLIHDQAQENEVLAAATIIQDGHIQDKKLKK